MAPRRSPTTSEITAFVQDFLMSTNSGDLTITRICEALEDSIGARMEVHYEKEWLRPVVHDWFDALSHTPLHRCLLMEDTTTSARDLLRNGAELHVCAAAVPNAPSPLVLKVSVAGMF
jgi:hypothetical protein